MKLLELWSEKVKTKKHPKEGLFASGSATEIAAWLKKSHEDLKDAMAALNFYVNRAGKNLSDTQKAKLAHVKTLLHAAGEKKEEKKEVKESQVKKLDDYDYKFESNTPLKGAAEAYYKTLKTM